MCLNIIQNICMKLDILTNTLLKDMQGKYKDILAELNIEILRGKVLYEFFHDNFDDVVLSQKT